MINVSIVEDDGRVRASLERLINSSEGFRCVSQHDSGEEAVARLPLVKPDVVLMDIKLPGMDGVECVRRLKRLIPAAQIIMLTVYQDSDVIFGALAAGATGYLLKRTSRAQLIVSIRDVHGGGAPMSSYIARKVVQSFRATTMPSPASETLSPREREVLDLLSKGYLYREIASVLSVSYDTIHTHVRKIYEKLQVHTRTQAVAMHLTHARPAGAGEDPDRTDGN
jgi:DNA-binding NarL/FixJ family response regulator